MINYVLIEKLIIICQRPILLIVQNMAMVKKAFEGTGPKQLKFDKVSFDCDFVYNKVCKW